MAPRRSPSSERSVPDLVLLDVMMPQASGYEVYKTIRRRPEWRHIKIVMLSAKGRDSEVVRGLTLGADLYVTKPFSTRELMAKIEGPAPRRQPVAPANDASMLHFAACQKFVSLT